MVYTEKEIKYYSEKKPLLNKIINVEPVVWLNSNRKKMNDFHNPSLTKTDMNEAESLWLRFAPYLEKAFPETVKTNGIIESPLKRVNFFQQEYENRYSSLSGGELYLKCDNELPIAGSIKARGGIYEVLHYAENLAMEEGLLSKESNYVQFDSDEFNSFFNQFTIGVGSTGNLGLSIGIISAKLGFQVSVYMSADVKQWKKDLLRAKGANVLEFSGDFSEAIKKGREKTSADPKGYFVDDEDSKHLFLGYSVAALRLQKQLDDQNIKVDADHPLFVYLPCGVGGSPGGVTFGLKQIYGDNVHCFFVEPTHSPSVLIGLLTGKMEKVSVQDFGLDNKTEADGLAVGRPSKFATPISNHLISGIYTLEDDKLFELLIMLADKENIYLEPSATAGLLGPSKVLHSNYLQQNNLNADNVTHIAWATGGALVPEEDMNHFYDRGRFNNNNSPLAD
ncbi:D-serine ammonia-lyase [Virgibacillus flavescens]|uniref:D-serine ammonia-lyase n=1 Tax=Virgibacillus flavescens TaxID=1611422 RepID=UPI003D345C0B